MREIKFRAWDSSSRKILSHDEILYDGDYDSYPTIVYALKSNVCELMQYTGLKDKNGKEIYEGDIVKGGIYYDSWKEDIGVVVFGEFESDNSGHEYCSETCFGWYVNPIKGKAKEDIECFDRYFNYNDFIVIGNIYENPEFLK